MNLIIDRRAVKELKKFTKFEQAKAREYLKLFEDYGFGLSQNYLKKVTNKLWELRPATLRLFLFVLKPNTIVIHAMKKKSQKMTKATKQLLKTRMKEWLL